MSNSNQEGLGTCSSAAGSCCALDGGTNSSPGLSNFAATAAANAVGLSRGQGSWLNSDSSKAVGWSSGLPTLEVSGEVGAEISGEHPLASGEVGAEVSEEYPLVSGEVGAVVSVEDPRASACSFEVPHFKRGDSSPQHGVVGVVAPEASTAVDVACWLAAGIFQCRGVLWKVSDDCQRFMATGACCTGVAAADVC